MAALDRQEDRDRRRAEGHAARRIAKALDRGPEVTRVKRVPARQERGRDAPAFEERFERRQVGERSGDDGLLVVIDHRDLEPFVRPRAQSRGDRMRARGDG
jgi:hypothetical protein